MLDLQKAARDKLLPIPKNIEWNQLKGSIASHVTKEASEFESDEIQRLQNAINAFNMEGSFCEIATVFIAMLILLNFVFVPLDNDSSSEDEVYSSSTESPSRTEFTVSDSNAAKLAANLLGVKSTDLVDILIARKITAGKFCFSECIFELINIDGILILWVGVSRQRHSIFRKPCERTSECEERLHSLTSFIYDRMFLHVLEYLNSTLKGDCGANPNGISTLSLLDLYGFENFNSNHLEQICINYANERLQQVNVSIIKSYYEQSVMEDEIFDPPTELNNIVNELHYRIEEMHTHIFAFFDEVIVFHTKFCNPN